MSLPSGFRPLALSTAIAAIVMGGLALAISHADTRPASAPASSLAPTANFASSTASIRAEQASPVIKSENDQRLYRSLTLDNGLKVLLVSDAKADKAAAAVDADTPMGQAAFELYRRFVEDEDGRGKDFSAMLSRFEKRSREQD